VCVWRERERDTDRDNIHIECIIFKFCIVLAEPTIAGGDIEVIGRRQGSVVLPCIIHNLGRKRVSKRNNYMFQNNNRFDCILY